MAVTETSVAAHCAAAKRAARALGTAATETRNAALEATSRLLEERTEAILEANAGDLADERAAGLTGALRDRLELTPERVSAMAAGVGAVRELDDPMGEVLERKTLASGIDLRKVRVPLGVVAVVYEARPNVTIDCAALTIKSGNAIVLRGSSYAERSNATLAAIAREALAEAGLPEDCVVSLGGGGHEELAELARQEGLVDLLIPRGGEGLKNAIKAVATLPVMYAAAGNCHVYVDAGADPEMARRIAYNAKVQRPGVCNAAETLLIDAAIADRVAPAILADLAAAGVELVGDERARAAAAGVEVGPAAAEDWDREYLGLKMAVAVVDGVAEAIEHVNEHGTGHSEAIVTDDTAAAEEFVAGVDAAAVYVNASTRFTDGFEYGMGAEIGNSTQKLHARGPIGMRELTTFKYVAQGSGQVRG
ncbi:MAG TPA: glutamate-5-semialdehyde dehydrogenase [Solirubrobacterales bacterium]|nr:glutamate-5-semialdehyde dehydrogenase [Solirubrobacterales bacterium]